MDKIVKNTLLAESSIRQSEEGLAGRMIRLIAELRATKPYQYVPLFVAICGSGSAFEREFYLRLTNEQYDEFKRFNLNWK